MNSFLNLVDDVYKVSDLTYVLFADLLDFLLPFFVKFTVGKSIDDIEPKGLFIRILSKSQLFLVQF